jgi:hypothetical protein
MYICLGWYASIHPSIHFWIRISNINKRLSKIVCASGLACSRWSSEAFPVLDAPAPVDQRLKSASLFSAHSCCISRGAAVAVLKMRRHAMVASRIEEDSAVVNVAPCDNVLALWKERFVSGPSKSPTALFILNEANTSWVNHKLRVYPAAPTAEGEMFSHVI